MATANKNVAVAAPTIGNDPFAVASVPDYIKQGQGRGSEEVKSSDMVLPRLEIVQALSPIKEMNPDAREGMLFNSVTGELLGDSVFFVPVYFRMEYLIWKDQDQGGGFFGSFPTLEQAEERKATEVGNGENPEYIEIVDTPVHYGLIITPDGQKEQIVISMAKTKAKVSRKWNAIIQIAGGDRFSRVYKISAFTDENKKGQKFKNFVVQPAGFPPKAIYEECERVYQSFRSGEVVADHASAAPMKDAGSERGEI